jgi:hypothetical protein
MSEEYRALLSTHSSRRTATPYRPGLHSSRSRLRLMDCAHEMPQLNPAPTRVRSHRTTTSRLTRDRGLNSNMLKMDVSLCVVESNSQFRRHANPASNHDQHASYVYFSVHLPRVSLSGLLIAREVYEWHCHVRFLYDCSDTVGWGRLARAIWWHNHGSPDTIGSSPTRASSHHADSC